MPRTDGFLPSLHELPPAGDGPGVWGEVAEALGPPAPDAVDPLEAALDPGLQRPKLAPDIEIVHHKTRWGGGYTMVRNPRGPVYLRLSAEDGRLMDGFDGERTVRELVVEELRETASFDVASASELVAVLETEGCLEVPWIETYEVIGERIAPARSRFSASVRRVAKHQTVHFPRSKEMTEWGYRHGGRWLFTKPGQVGLVLLLLTGVAALVANLGSGRFELAGDSLAVGFGVLFFLDLFATMIHEAGHALAIRHARREVLNAGFQLYLGHPAFFIDSADILMTPPRDRIRNAWYGPFLSLCVAGTASVLAFTLPDGRFTDTLFRLSVLTYLTAMLNLIPFLELDGYWMLVDALDTPDLRPRSLAFLWHDLPRKLRRRDRLSKQEVGLVAFGVVGSVFTVIALATSVLLWGPLFDTFSRAMWERGPLMRVLLVLLLAAHLRPAARGPRQVGEDGVGSAAILGRRVRFRGQLRWRRRPAS